MLSPPATGMPDPVVLSTMAPQLEAGAIIAAGGGSAVYPVAAMAFFFPVRLTQPRTYTTAWWLNGATAAGSVDVGIYTIDGTTATRVVASTAAVQAGVSAMQVATAFTTTTIGPGLFYLAISCTLATATFWRSNVGPSTLRRLGCFQAATSSPLPATVTVAAINSTFLPVFGFAESAAI